MKLVGKSQRDIRSTSTAFSLLFFIRSRISFCFFAWASCNKADLRSDCITRTTRDYFCCGFSDKKTSSYLSYVFVDSRNGNPTKTHGWLGGDRMVERWWWRCWNMRGTSSSSSSPSSKGGGVVVWMNCRYVFRLGQPTIMSLAQRIEGSDSDGRISFQIIINSVRFVVSFGLNCCFK